MNYQLIIIIAIMVLPALKQVYDKLQERAELEKRKREQTRAHTETLRTGRSEPSPSPRPRATPRQAQPRPVAVQSRTAPADRTRLQQLEAERERRLRELRRIAQQRSQSSQSTTKSSRRTERVGSQGPTAYAKRPPKPAARPTQATPQPDAAGLGAPVGSFEGMRPGAIRRQPGAGAGLGHLSQADLRRGFILIEVLGKPVALREGHPGAGIGTG